MIRKFATVPAFSVVLRSILVTILTGAATVYAQQTPAEQATVTAQLTSPIAPGPADSPASPAAGAPRKLTTRREPPPAARPKPQGLQQLDLQRGRRCQPDQRQHKEFVRGGGGIAAAGVARNYSKYFGLRLDFQWDNLPLRTSALQSGAGARRDQSRVLGRCSIPSSIFPPPRVWGGYILGGPGIFHRSGKLDSSTAIPGSACNSFFLWWGHCFNDSLPIDGNFLHSSQNQFGYNFGGGVTRKIRPNMEIYAEFRYLHGKHDGITTDVRPITIGVRW